MRERWTSNKDWWENNEESEGDEVPSSLPVKPLKTSEFDGPLPSSRKKS
jgi:hypothetical protein